MTDSVEESIRIFVSYARKDKRWLDNEYKYNLIPWLIESTRRLNVVFWYDKELVASEVFMGRIHEEIDKAHIAILIVSQPFLNSDFIEKHELPRIKNRAAQKNLSVVPVLVEPCSWQEDDFLCERQMLPGKPTPLINYTERDAEWAQVKFDLLDSIKRLIKKIRFERTQAGETQKNDRANAETAQDIGVQIQQEATSPAPGEESVYNDAKQTDFLEVKTETAYAIPYTATPDIVVINDSDSGFPIECHKNLDSFLQDGGAKPCAHWVVLYLSNLSETCLSRDKITNQNTDNLVVIVSAEELRRHDVRLSQGLSWEATAEDLTAELYQNPLLQPLLKARHLIVTFQYDGAYWLNNAPGAANSLLVFDASRAEGEWANSKGSIGAFVFLSTFMAAIVRELCIPSKEIIADEGKAKAAWGKKLVPDFEMALSTGLGASRELRRHSRKRVADNDKEATDTAIQFSEFIGICKQDYQPISTGNFVSAMIPHSGCARGHWMMLDEWQVLARSSSRPRPHFDAAMAVAFLGAEALERFPCAQFGAYQTVDRKEIESLRAIRQFINNYGKEEQPRTPLNLGVFAPPGSDKTKMLIQIAKASLNIKDNDILLFNLSQFNAASDLTGAFQQIVGKISSGVTPLVFWNEFDAQGYRWLQYLLAPMEDGIFQDGRNTTPIGKCIFVFAGSTSSTFYNFGPINPDTLANDELEKLMKQDPDKLREMERTWREFLLAKGPAFKSLLLGYLNMLGVNRRLISMERNGRRIWSVDERDLCFPVRRALLIRSTFKTKKGDRLKLDSSVLRALLEIPIYKTGDRSLQFICTYLANNNSGIPGRSNLPSLDLLNMHVDAEEFWKLCEQDHDFSGKAKDLASLLHRGYCLRICGNTTRKDVAIEFEKLPEDLQRANIAQALRIPGILRLAGMHLEPGDVVPFDQLLESRSADEEPLRQHLAARDRLEVLAEAEHNGWMVERMLSGWKYSRKKDKPRKLHDCLIPYSQSTDEIKYFDRLAIIGKAAPADKPDEEQFGYVDMVKVVGLRVVMDE
jgi:hypothetical protein